MKRYLDLYRDFAASIPYPEEARAFVTECGRYIDRIDSLADAYHFNIYNTHGERHSQTVTGLCAAFLELIPLLAITPTERRTLFLAGYCHDLGMVTGDRRRHAQQTQVLLDGLWDSFKLTSASEAKAVGWVSVMHSSRTDPEGVAETVVIEGLGRRDHVRVRLLGAILRICDALHCTSDRIPPLAVQEHLGVLPDVQLREYHKHYLFDEVTLGTSDQCIDLRLEGSLRHDIPNVREVLKEACDRLAEEIASVAYLFAPAYRFKETAGRPFSYAVQLVETSAPLVPPSSLSVPATDEERPRGFIGRRDELEELDRWLGSSQARPIFVIGGLGGIGKTTLLQQFRARHPTRCFGVRADQIGPSAERLFEILLRLLPARLQREVDEFLDESIRLQQSGPERVAACAALLGSLLLTICIDDYHAIQSAEMDSAIIGLARRSPGLSFLLASRTVPQLAEDPKNPVRVRRIDGMVLEDTRTLLAQFGMPELVLEDARAVETVWRCTGEGHPLAVVVFANMLGQHSFATISDVAELLPSYTDEMWEKWVGNLLSRLDEEERSVLDALSVIRVPSSITLLAAVAEVATLESALKGLKQRFLVQTMPAKLVSLHPLLQANLYDHLVVDTKRRLHARAAAQLVPPVTDRVQGGRLLPLENYEAALDHADRAGESDRVVALARKLIGDLLLGGRIGPAENACILVEKHLGRRKWPAWYLIRKARMLSAKGDHWGCRTLLDEVDAKEHAGSIASEALQIRALDLIQQGRGAEAFAVLSRQFRIARHQKIAARLAITALRCVAADAPVTEMLQHIEAARRLDVSDSAHVARCDLLSGERLLASGDHGNAREKLASAVEVLAGFSHDDTRRCLEGLVACCEALNLRSERERWDGRLRELESGRGARTTAC